jgi:RimJ/RimL family protein N-acetyltransferase
MRSSAESLCWMAEVIAETERLILRTWRDSDRTEYLATCNTDAVTAHLGGPASIEDIDAAIGRIRQNQEEHGVGFWSVERKADGMFLGYCGLKVIADDVTPVTGEVEIGWRLREDAWGQGYALEAARACLDWAWANLGVPRIVSFTAPANAPSWRLMERLGMVRRPDLDFAHPKFPADHPLSRHITYVIERP